MNNRIQSIKRAAALLTITLCLGAWTTAMAQLDPGTYAIFQGEKQVGMVYATPRSGNQTLYSEHWVYFPDYVEPTAHNGVKTVIRPDASAGYKSESDFLLRAPWGTGYHYMHVTCSEALRLPGR